MSTRSEREVLHVLLDELRAATAAVSDARLDVADALTRRTDAIRELQRLGMTARGIRTALRERP